MGSKVGWLTDKEEEGGKQKCAVSAVCRRRKCSSDNCVSGWNFQLTLKKSISSGVQSMFSFVFFFFAQSKELSPSWRESYFKTDSKYCNEMGRWTIMKRGLLTDLTWRCKVEQWGKTRVCSPFLRFRRERVWEELISDSIVLRLKLSSSEAGESLRKSSDNIFLRTRGGCIFRKIGTTKTVWCLQQGYLR